MILCGGPCSLAALSLNLASQRQHLLDHFKLMLLLQHNELFLCVYSFFLIYVLLLSNGRHIDDLGPYV